MKKMKTLIKISLFAVASLISTTSFASDSDIEINQCGEMEIEQFTPDNPECGFLHVAAHTITVEADGHNESGEPKLYVSHGMKLSRYEASASCDNGVNQSEMEDPSTAICK